MMKRYGTTFHGHKITMSVRYRVFPFYWQDTKVQSSRKYLAKNAVAILGSASGFSLVSVTVALGIGAIAMLAMQTITVNSMRAQAEIVQRAEFQDLTRQIQQSIDSPACTQSFAGFTIDPAILGTPQTGNGLSAGTVQILHPALGGRVTAKTGTTLNGLVVSKVAVQVERIVGRVAVSTILIEVKKTASGLHSSLQDVLLKKSISVTFQIDTAFKIIECRSLQRASKQVISTVLARNYHDQVDVACAGLTINYWFFASACNRFCSNGCAIGPGNNCMANLPGLGYSTGYPSECNGGTQEMLCTCLP
jgi:hypothetical protein